MKVKLCGFTDADSLQVAIAEKCDFLGFVFCQESPRYITTENAALISSSVPKNIAKVAVVANHDLESLAEISQKFHPDFFQFHGEETLEFLKKIRQKFPKIKIIKAFKITDSKDLEQVKDFENVADFFLFDSKIAGSGKKFNWEILKNFYSKKDWFLSGGLNVDNIEEASSITGTKMIDISSGIEEIRGKKSPKLIRQLMEKIRNHVS
jgi:phosphoribosylanthranilate isomerase